LSITTASTHRIGRREYGLLGFLAFPFVIMQGPGLAILPNLYAQKFPIDLAELGVALLVVRLLFDAALNPVIGYLSDRTRTPIGRRKPWIIIGAAISVFGIYQLYVPPQQASLHYLVIWISVVTAGWTIFDVAYTAWSAELTHDYDGRARIAFIRQFFSNAGLLCLALAPFALSRTHEMDFDVLHAAAWFSLLAMPLVAALTLVTVPQGDSHVPTESANPLRSLMRTLSNRPFQWFCGYSFFVYLAMGSAGALFFLFFSSYLKLGPHFTLVTVNSMAWAIASIPVWNRVIERTSKRTVMLGGTIVLIGSLLMAHVLYPGKLALPLYMVMDASWYISLVAIESAMRASIGDIVDFDQLRTREQRAGEFTAAWTLTCKAALAIGSASAYSIVALFGFDPKAETVTEHGALGLKVTMGAFPASLLLIAIALVLAFPLTRARSAVVRRAVERQERRGRLA